MGLGLAGGGINLIVAAAHLIWQHVSAFGNASLKVWMPSSPKGQTANSKTQPLPCLSNLQDTIYADLKMVRFIQTAVYRVGVN